MGKKIWVTDRRTKIIVIITMSLVLMGVLFLKNWRQNVPTINEKWSADTSRAFIDFSKKAQTMWSEGRTLIPKSEAEKICQKSWEGKSYHESFLQCNPDYFSCLLEKSNFGDFSGVKIKKSIKNYQMLLSRNPLNSEGGVEYQFNFIVELQGLSIERSLYLLDTCKETYLPQRLYGLNSREQAKVWEWDNFNSHIFIDRHLVNVGEVRRWNDLLKKNITIPKKDDFEAATFLNKNQMHEFCFDHGKEVLSAMVYDAAVFHPRDYDNPRSPFLNRSRFPWNRSNLQNFIFKKWKSKDTKMTRDECEKVYSKECQAIMPYKHSSTLSNSWIGLFEVMGGSFEYVQNKVDPAKNLILSSKYFSIISRVHEVGIRGFWSGEHFDFQAFDFGKYKDEIDDQNDIEVGFRCMRRVNE